MCTQCHTCTWIVSVSAVPFFEITQLVCLLFGEWTLIWSKWSLYLLPVPVSERQVCFIRIIFRSQIVALICIWYWCQWILIKPTQTKPLNYLVTVWASSHFLASFYGGCCFQLFTYCQKGKVDCHPLLGLILMN